MKTSKTLNNIIVISLILIIWTVLTYLNNKTHTFNAMWFAGIDEVFKSIIDIFNNDFINISASVWLLFKALFYVIILGVGFGVLVGYFDSIYDSIYLSIDFWRSIPPIIVIGIFRNFDGTTDELYWRIWLVIFGTLPIMIMQIADAVNTASKSKIEIFQSINSSFLFKIRKIIIYEIMPSFFSTIRTIISLSLIIIIVSEMIFTPKYGIGGRILHYQTASEIQYVYAYAIITGLIGILFNRLVRFIENKVILWK